MIIGTRVLSPEEVCIWDTELIQISIYYGLKDNHFIIETCTNMCRDLGIRYVIHPVGYFILNSDMFESLMLLAQWSDLALILHDEKTPHGKRLHGQHEKNFRSSLEKLSSITPVSFENATDTRDARWFWHNFADSITLDIGHVESTGIDAVEYVRVLDKEEIEKIHYVHMHRNNGWRNGLTDHWPLLQDCRELMALKELLNRKKDIAIILEINEADMIGDSIKLLKTVRDEFFNNFHNT